MWLLHPLVSQCNPIAGVFASFFLRLESRIVMWCHLLGIVVCCRRLCLEINFFPRNCWMNSFTFLSSSGAADGYVAYCFPPPIYDGRAWVWLALFYFLCGWTVSVICRCILAVTDSLVSIYNPSLEWSRCILCRPTLLWLCNFLLVCVWGGAHVFLPHISRLNRLPLVWIVLVSISVSRVLVLVCFVGSCIC